MSSGLYDMSEKNFDKTLDLTMLKPYGDTMNDGKVQLSFTLPVPNNDRGTEAARLLSRQMGLSEPNVAYARSLDQDFTFYVVYGSCTHSVDYTKIQIQAIEDVTMEMDDLGCSLATNKYRLGTPVAAVLHAADAFLADVPFRFRGVLVNTFGATVKGDARYYARHTAACG